MKLRLTGKSEEIDVVIGILRDVNQVELLEVSDYYPNRGASKLGRVYVEMEVR